MRKQKDKKMFRYLKYQEFTFKIFSDEKILTANSTETTDTSQSQQIMTRPNS